MTGVSAGAVNFTKANHSDFRLLQFAGLNRAANFRVELSKIRLVRSGLK